MVGSWRLVAAGGWRRLVAGGWWRLVAGCPSVRQVRLDGKVLDPTELHRQWQILLGGLWCRAESKRISIDPSDTSGM